MNFDTKHLVRWGIPGWIMIMMLGPFISFAFEGLSNILTSKNTVAIGAFLTLIGVPLGYLLNQIHHSLFWVLPRRKLLRKIDRFRKKGSWNQYFINEINIDEIFFFDEIGKKKKERYQYLLSRKHELGGVTVSLGITALIILSVNLGRHLHEVWSWSYFVVVFILCLLLWNSRNYSSSNIQIYYDHYLIESNEHRDNLPTPTPDQD
ncbi:hypothetical protein JOC77_003458 [Peribacillus deserti]|uniref:Glycosyl-4,4'-diaponeurosporenoate acyltransferase n=1 Tax=Peribacillus deserti TaxID=673318 RepID=A0ABS2QLG4_9BACI|nr:hypothetical protein [Peribacillus deserti]MBM7694014.1 hypothetical protein [Peribacillus deserti]